MKDMKCFIDVLYMQRPERAQCEESGTLTAQNKRRTIRHFKTSSNLKMYILGRAG